VALGEIVEAIASFLSLPFPSARPKSRSDRIQSVLALALWAVFLAALALGLWSYFQGE